MHSALRCLIVLLGTAVAQSPAFAATSAGVYAILDEVVLEPQDRMPERVRLSGIFVVPQPVSSGLHRPPVEGHLYFNLNANDPDASRRDWHALRDAAGTGEVVGFAEYWVSVQDEKSLARLPPHLRSNANMHTSLVVEVHTGTVPVLPVPYPKSNARGVLTSFDGEADVCPRFGKSASNIIASLRQAHTPGISYPELPVCAASVGLLDTMTLDASFLEQDRADDWADVAEGVLAGRIAATGVELSHYDVACRTTICHATFSFPTLEYQNTTGQSLIYEAVFDVPGFAEGGKINPGIVHPQLDIWVQRRSPD